MKALLSRLDLACAMCAHALCPGAATVVADSPDGLEGLTEEEKAYVMRMRSVNESVRFALFRQGERFVEGDVVKLGYHMPDLDAIDAMLRGWKTDLAGYAPEYRASPAASMQDLAGTFDGFARTLDRAYDPCFELLQEEGRLRMLEDGREWLSGLLGADLGADGPRPTVIAKLHAAVAGEQVRMEDRFADVSAALEVRVSELQEAQQVGESFLDIWLDDCFLTAAAMGTRTLQELDVLRGFRDEVLLRSRAGSDFVDFYYAASPSLARFLYEHEAVQAVVRQAIVNPVVRAAALLQPLWIAA